jgi:hypothetical protein
MAFATTSCKGKGKKASGRTKYISNSNWKAMSPEAQTKVINAHKKSAEDDDDEKSSATAKLAKTMKSISKTMKSLEKNNRRLKISVSALQKCKEDDDNDSFISSTEGLSHFQKAIKFLNESCPKIALALKSSKSLNLDLRCFLLLDNQSTFDLCCNWGFMSRIRNASCALNMTSNGRGLKITKQGKFPGYKFWVWFSKKAITNIISLKPKKTRLKSTGSHMIAKLRQLLSSIANSLVSLTCSSKCTQVICTSAIQIRRVSLDSSKWSKTT